MKNVSLLIATTAIGLTACCPVAFQCAKVTVQPRQTVPAPLLVNHPVPEWSGKTLRDALEYAVDSNDAALRCEADRSSIRQTQVLEAK